MIRWEYEAPKYSGDETAHGASITGKDSSGRTTHWIPLTAYPSENHQRDAREMVRMLNEAADMLAPVPELEGSIPLVLYFSTRAEADEFTALVQQAKPGLVAKQL